MSSAAAQAPGLRPALLNPCFWPEIRRGSERFARDLADGLTGHGHHPTLITSHPGRPSRSTEDGLAIIRNWRPPDGRLRRRLYEDYLTHVPFSYLSLRRGDFDLAHALYPTDALAAARWSAEGGGPSILSYMGIPSHFGLLSRRRRVEITLRAARGCDAVVALSDAAAAAFSRWLGIEARVIHPGVNVELFAPGSERAQAPTIFCGAAIEEPRKRVRLLLSAARRIRRRRPDLRLVLSRPKDPALVAELEATEEGIELRDVDDERALVATYRESWVSVLPSEGEAFGLVLVEALACGTPVVAGASGGAPEIVNSDAVGRLFDDDEEEGLASRLDEALELATDPSTAAACRARAEHFSVARCVEAYERLYRELLGAPAGRAPEPIGAAPER